MPPSSHEATTAKSNSLAKQSVLAANFVPAHLRKVNEWQVTAPFHAAPRPGSSHGMGLKGLLVPFVPICYCVAGQQRISNAKPLHCFPLVAAPSDLYYAVETNRQTVEASSSQSKSKGLDGPLESATRVTPVVDSISSLADYLEVWTNLLELERKEVLLRYENYSQYSRPIGVRPVVAQADITSMKNQTNQQVELVATMDANGIADASPPIMIGDTVLVRPVHLVALPQHDFLNHFIPLQACQWTVDIHCAEVQSTVLSVLRGSKTAANISGVDKIVLSWMNPIEWDVLLCTMTMKISSGGPGNSMEEPMYNFRFVPSVTSHNSCLTALQWLTKSYRGNPHGAMEWLFPNTAPVVSMTLGEVAARDILISSQKLNIKQASFVNMVLGRTQHPSVGLVRPPMVLTGPAGTGKTKTMLCAVHAVLAAGATNKQSFRILVCTPSHTAADVITQRLGTNMKRDQLFRLYSPDRPVATVPTAVIGFCRQSSDQTGAFILPDVGSLMKFQVIVCTCIDAHLLYRIGLTNEQLRTRRQCYETYLTETCKGTNLAISLSGVEDSHFTHLFIDEAAQATEPETLIPFSVVVDPTGLSSRSVEITLVGDPRQLSPSVYSHDAIIAGMGRSFLERLLLRPVNCLGGGRDHMLGPDLSHMEDWIKYSFQLDGLEQLSAFLTTNYRGHPSFLMMPSALFYSDKLQSTDHKKDNDAGESFWCQKLRHVETLADPVKAPTMGSDLDEPDEVRCRKQFSWPIHFRGVQGNETSVTIQSGFANSSWENKAEAHVVVEICVSLRERGISSKSIGIMASFRGQVVLIRKLLRLKNLGGINVGTIEDYQSVEHDVIVLSLVRATPSFVEHDVKNRMGVFGQPKRSNVALTRAEFLFIVVGNPVPMVQDSIWFQFILFCHRNGLYYGDPPDDLSILSWAPNKTLARYYQAKAENPFAHGTLTSQAEEDAVKESVVVGTLERAMRH